MKKQAVVELLNQFPDEVDAEKLMESLYLRAKLDRAEATVARGQTLTHGDLVEESEKWFK
jgi:hypothetical protein